MDSNMWPIQEKKYVLGEGSKPLVLLALKKNLCGFNFLMSNSLSLEFQDKSHHLYKQLGTQL